MKVTPRTPSGFPEYLPEEQIEFNRLMAIIRSTYEKYGFSPIDTPDVELSEILLAKGGGETEQQIYRFERGRNDLSLRFDLTVPLARYAAQHAGNLTFPFRRYHIGKVHRAERAQAGRFREFYQCDIDVIGSTDPVVDAEFPAVINEIFERFDFGEFVIRLNNRLVLNGFFEGIGLSDKSQEVLRAIDKMEKISTEEFVSELKKLDLTDEQISKIQTFTAISGDNESILEQLSELGIESEQLTEGIEKLRVVTATLRAFNVPEHRFKIDLKIARGLDYYTGTVYETNLVDYPELGSVCSGGRYDNLAENYTNTVLPGVGISIGLSRLFYKLREIGVIKAEVKTPARVIILPFNADCVPYAATIASQLRERDVATLLYADNVPLKKKMKYAHNLGVQYVIVIGDNEVESRTLSLKNMQTGESTSLPASDVAQHLYHLQ